MSPNLLLLTRTPNLGFNATLLKHPLLLLGRKAMTNLDNVLKSIDIIFPTKIHIVKAMVFPVVMYRSESWIIKKVEP